MSRSTGTLLNDSTGQVIGTAQYDLWRSYFGTSAGSLEAIATAEIPEPSALVLATLVALSLCSRGSPGAALRLPQATVG